MLERGHVAPDALHLRHQRRGHGVKLLTPVVLHGVEAQCGLVAHQLFFEQAAAVKGVLAQHALAPGVDGVDGGVVHGLRGQRQAVGGLLAGFALGVVGLQFQQEIVFGFGHAAEHLGRLGQAGPDAVRQLARGGAGEGHHQHVLRQQGAHRRGVGVAVAQHQAHIERSNRPGLARASARLDQLAATQWKGVRLQLVGAAHASSPSSSSSS